KVRMDGVILGGPPVDNVALDQEGQRTLYRLAGVCALIGLTIAFICLRSVRLTLFVFWIAALSAGVALAIVSLTGGTCDSILLSMPALVYVLGMSGAVHLINYYHDAIREKGLEGATERAVRHAFTPCFFAQLTTALGLGSLFAGRLVPISKFGFYSAIGVLCTLLLLFLYLPALLYFYPSRKFAQEHGGKGLEVNPGRLHRFWDWLGALIIRRHNWVLVLCFGLMIFFGAYLPKIKTSVKMMSFFSPDADIVQNYTWLEEKLGPLVPMELVVCFDNDKLYRNSFRTAERLALIEKLVEKLKTDLDEDVGGALSVALFTPNVDEMATPGSAAHRTVSTVVGKTVDENRDALRDYLTVEGDPSLDELLAFLDERAASSRANYERAREEFEASLRSEFVGSDLDVDLETFKTTNESDLDERLAPYFAKYQTLEEQERDANKLEEEARTLRERKDYLAEQDATRLSELLAATSGSHSLRRLAFDENERLRDAATRWRREKGVEIWRISLRVWSLKKDIDYSAFIENVKNVVEPTLAEASIALDAALARSTDGDALQQAEAAQLAVENERRFVAENLEKEKANGKNAKDAKTLARDFALKDLTDAQREELKRSMGEDHVEDWIYPAGFSA
ncbi:MAG: MMPL family transporter, partial [Thermoguttaceae bacterium]|nr:MMPL family transporter [Thermoguttaceae bacterium]